MAKVLDFRVDERTGHKAVTERVTPEGVERTTTDTTVMTWTRIELLGPMEFWWETKGQFLYGADGVGRPCLRSDAEHGCERANDLQWSVEDFARLPRAKPMTLNLLQDRLRADAFGSRDVCVAGFGVGPAGGFDVKYAANPVQARRDARGRFWGWLRG